MSKLTVALVRLLAVGVTISFAAPASAENVLRWASVGGALTFDPHSGNHGPSIIQQDPVYERLLNTSSRLEVVPQLRWRGDLSIR